MGVRNSDALRERARDGAARGGGLLAPPRPEPRRSTGRSRRSATRLTRARRDAAAHRRGAGARRRARRRRPRGRGAGALQRDPDGARASCSTTLLQPRARRDQGVRARRCAIARRGRGTAARACCELAAAGRARAAGDETPRPRPDRGASRSTSRAIVPFLQHAAAAICASSSTAPTSRAPADGALDNTPLVRASSRSAASRRACSASRAIAEL